jgi:surfeit locus 1 family protein
MPPRRGFHPPFWPTVMAVPMVLILLGLGVWQLQRLEEKNAAIEDRIERTTAAPVAFPFTAEGVDLPALEFHRSAVTGRFLNDREFHLLARSLAGEGEAGYQVITPLEVTAGPHAGAIVLVNRGWVPMDRADPASRAAGQINGETTVEGVIRPPGRQNWMVPDNEPSKNVWFWSDLAGMARQLGGSAPVAPVFLEAAAGSDPRALPRGGQTRIDVPNDHLQYAVTWFALAVAMAVIWFIYSRGYAKGRRGGKRRDGTPAP